MRRPREGKNVEQKQSVRALLQRDAPLTKKAQLRALIQLSLPAIFAQLTSIMMQYIDAAMVGALGAEASAAIGVVSTSTWLLSGLCTAAASGFSVQVAQRIGAADEQGARSVVKHGLLITLLFALALSFAGSMISSFLPGWLGADPSLHADASGYFLIYVCALPFLQMSLLGAYLLQCSGDMKVPSILNASMCGFDVIFNLIFIRCFGVLGAVFTDLFQIHGAVMSYSESLLYAGYQHLDLTHIFMASIFIGASGAIMDLSVDITSAVHEVVEKRPDLKWWEAARSGMNVGRAAMGTMTTTLLFAYSGGYVALLMVFMAQGTPLTTIFNYKYVAAEIIHTVIGSFGLVTVAPFTALCAGLFLAGKQPRRIPQPEPSPVSREHPL